MGRESDHPTPPSTEDMNTWSYTSLLSSAAELVLETTFTFDFTFIHSLICLLRKETIENACNSTNPPHRCVGEVAGRARRGNNIP
jgi:hypothetical protein